MNSHFFRANSSRLEYQPTTADVFCNNYAHCKTTLKGGDYLPVWAHLQRAFKRDLTFPRVLAMLVPSVIERRPLCGHVGGKRRCGGFAI